MKRLSSQTNENLTYRVYKELAGDIFSPIHDNDMTFDLKFELYKSKLVYLYNIREQCFKHLNSVTSKLYEYTQEDMLNIHKAIDITKEYLNQTIRDSLQNSFQNAHSKGLYASKFQPNN